MKLFVTKILLLLKFYLAIKKFRLNLVLIVFFSFVFLYSICIY